jgi:acetyl-CoA carboxylase biotin carboxyl carrier protein
LEIKEIKAIVDLMKRSSLSEFELKDKDFKLRICRKNGEIQTVYQPSTPPPFPVAAAHVAAPPPAAAPAAAPAAKAEEKLDDAKVIKSPMVGTFYSAPSPESPSFVKSGDAVVEDTVVCIIEAMKVMNEITADMSGKIAEVLVQNGDNIEYGQPLFRLQ